MRNRNILKTYTDTDFDNLSWHDCHMWGIRFRCGNPEEDDWTSDLVLDIDFIEDWVCGVDGNCQFRVAPATLVFHDVTDPRIDIRWEPSGYQVSIHEISIGNISRERVKDQQICFDRSYYCWLVELNWPDGSEITFGASGFTQTVLAEPLLIDNQYLTLKQRAQLLAT